MKATERIIFAFIALLVAGSLIAATPIKSLVFQGNADAGGFQITGLGSPTNASNAATLGYVTNGLAGMQPLSTNLTSLSGLTTAEFGRGLLELSDADGLIGKVNEGNAARILTSRLAGASVLDHTLLMASPTHGGTYVVNTVAGHITITLPQSPVDGDTFVFVDALGTWSAGHTVTLQGGAAAPIDGEAAIASDRTGAILTVIYVEGEWRTRLTPVSPELAEVSGLQTALDSKVTGSGAAFSSLFDGTGGNVALAQAVSSVSGVDGSSLMIHSTGWVGDPTQLSDLLDSLGLELSTFYDGSTGYVNQALFANYADSGMTQPLTQLFDGTGGNVAQATTVSDVSSLSGYAAGLEVGYADVADSAIYSGANLLSSLFDGTGGYTALAGAAYSAPGGGSLNDLFSGSGGYVYQAVQADHANNADGIFNGTIYVNPALLFDGTGNISINTINVGGGSGTGGTTISSGNVMTDGEVIGLALTATASSIFSGDKQLTPLIVNPTTVNGFAVTVGSAKCDYTYYLTPAGTLATGTFHLPTSATSTNTQIVRVFSTQTITALTVDVSGSGVIKGAALTTLGANTGAAWQRVSSASNGTWIRLY